MRQTNKEDGMDKKTVSKMVDEAGLLDESIKLSKVKLDVLKGKLKDFARDSKEPSLFGDAFVANTSRLVETSVDMKALKTMLVSLHGQFAIDALIYLVNPNITALREWMKKENVHESKLISVVKSDSYGKIGFKRTKKASRTTVRRRVKL